MNQITHKREIVWKRYIHLKDLAQSNIPSNFKIDVDKKFKKIIYQKVLAKVGSKRKLSRILGYGYRNIDNWVSGKQFSIGINILNDLCKLSKISLKETEKHITRIKVGRVGKFLHVKFPFYMFAPKFVRLLIHIFGDGSLSLSTTRKKAHYYNTNPHIVLHVKRLINDIFNPSSDYSIWSPYKKGSKVSYPRGKVGIAKKDELGINVPSFVPYILTLFCNSSKEFKSIGVRDLILQVPDKCIRDIVEGLIDDEGHVKPDYLVVFATNEKLVAEALKTRLLRNDINSVIYFTQTWNLVINDVNSIEKLIKLIRIRGQKRKKILKLVSILRKPTAAYYQIDNEILTLLNQKPMKGFTTTEIAWKIGRRRAVVGNVLKRLYKQGVVLKKPNPNRKRTFIYQIKTNLKSVNKNRKNC